MNRDLLARTRPEFYAEMVDTLRSGDVPEERIAATVAEYIRQMKSLLNGKCPTCGAPSTRYVDRKRQQGPSTVPGTWVMYRCSTQSPPGTRSPDGACDFMMDLKEGEASN